MSVRGLFAGAGSQPTGAASYRYWRVYVQTNNGDASYSSVAEIELRGSVGGADLTSAATPATSSTSLSATYDASKTVDGNTSTIWLPTVGNPTNQWLRYDLGTSTLVAQVAIYPQSDALARAPKDFIIQGSSDGTNFTDVKAFTNTTGWTATWRTFDL